MLNVSKAISAAKLRFFNKILLKSTEQLKMSYL